jgi:hypothetical protein
LSFDGIVLPHDGTFGHEEGTIVAVAHQILVTAFSILRDQTQYREWGG